MLGLVVWFILAALVSGICGFGFVAGTTALVAKVGFLIFSLLSVTALLTGRRTIAM
ncbi:MAG: DUF1328 domain-containing protein [Anaerolineae bacterium]|nr:DUF1328 domain-containing protein [Anaerolineae bacterium]